MRRSAFTDGCHQRTGAELATGGCTLGRRLRIACCKSVPVSEASSMMRWKPSSMMPSATTLSPMSMRYTSPTTSSVFFTTCNKQHKQQNQRDQLEQQHCHPNSKQLRRSCSLKPADSKLQAAGMSASCTCRRPWSLAGAQLCRQAAVLRAAHHHPPTKGCCRLQQAHRGFAPACDSDLYDVFLGVQLPKL